MCHRCHYAQSERLGRHMTQKHGLLFPRPCLAPHPLPVPLLTLSHVASVQESPAASLLRGLDLLPRLRPLTAEEAAVEHDSRSSRSMKRLLGMDLQSFRTSVKRPAPSVQTPAASMASRPASPCDSGGGCSPLLPPPPGASHGTLESGVAAWPSGASGGSGQLATGTLPCSLPYPTDYPSTALFLISPVSYRCGTRG